MCYEILGMDVILDINLKPYLLEVNHTPSFTTDTPLDKSIKKNLIRDTLLLLNINPKNKIRIKNNLKMEF
jgi:tubulin polyglutamylase TTLL6/13